MKTEIFIFFFLPFLFILIIPVFSFIKHVDLLYLLFFFIISFICYLLSKKNFVLKIIAFFICILILLFTIFFKMHVRNNLVMSLNCSDVKTVYGKVVSDSTYSSSGNTVTTVLISNVENIRKDILSASGLMTLVCKEDVTLTCGCMIKAEGFISEDSELFICENISVIDKNWINQLREKIIFLITKRVLGDSGKKDSRLLSLLLMTGRVESSDFKIKELAFQCGCLHILALSGMHLNFISSFIRTVTGKKKYSFFFALVFDFIFVFIAGPRPSLIRAFILFCFFKLDKHLRLFLTVLIQTVLFPYSISNLGNVYGYISVVALVVYAPYLSSALCFFLPKKISNIIGASITVLLVNAPIQIIVDGAWAISSILAAPISVFFVVLSMIGGFLTLIFGLNLITDKVMSVSYILLEKTFSTASVIPKMHVLGYIVFLVISLLFILVIKIYSKRVRKHAEHILSNIHFLEKKGGQDDPLLDLKYVEF